MIPLLLVAVLIKERIVIIEKGLWMYIALFLWGSLSLFYTVDEPMTFRYLQGILGNIIIWYLASRCIRKINDIKKLSYPLMVSFIVQLYFTLVAQTMASVEVINEKLERTKGLSRNENDQGRLLFFGIIIAVLLIMYSINKMWKAAYWTSIVLFFAGIFRTGSRSSLIAAVIFLIIFIFLLAKKRNYGLLIVSLVIGYFLYSYGYDYFLNDTSMGHRIQIAIDKGSEQSRITLLIEGWGFFLSNPFLGVGLGSYVYYSSTHHYSHNDFIEILASMGFPAFLIYAAIYRDYWKKVRVLFKYASGYYKKLIVVEFAFLVGYVALGIWAPSFYYPTTTLMLAFFYSLVNKNYQQYKTEKRSRRSNIETFSKMLAPNKIN